MSAEFTECKKHFTQYFHPRSTKKDHNSLENYTIRCRIESYIDRNHLEVHHKSTGEYEQENPESADKFYYVKKKQRIDMSMSMFYICNLYDMIGGKETITLMNAFHLFCIEFMLKINKWLLIQNWYCSFSIIIANSIHYCAFEFFFCAFRLFDCSIKYKSSEKNEQRNSSSTPISYFWNND